MKFDPKALQEAFDDVQAQRIAREMRDYFVLGAPPEITLIYSLYLDKAQRRAQRRKTIALGIGGFIVGWLLWRTLVWWMTA